jgi:hypothetical protein
MKWCPSCGRPKEQHKVEEVRTVMGMQRKRVCPVEKVRGSSASPKPTRYRVPVADDR